MSIYKQNKKNHFRIGALLLIIIAGIIPTVFAASLATVQCENMTLSGQYTSKISSPFNGVALYANNDAASTTYSFSTVPGNYHIDLHGASNNSNTAYVSLYIGSAKAGEFSFTGTSAAVSTVNFTVNATGSQTVKLICEKDNGNWDTYIDYYDIYYDGQPAPPPPAPNPPSTGAGASGTYRNLFKEYGKSDSEISAILTAAWNQLFYGDSNNQAVYYPVGTDLAYIKDVSNNDVRSEGMSYGMMICVQMNKQTEFNRLWKWARTNMYHADGEFKGFFAWQCGTDGHIMDNTPASDGDEYFATALFMATGRWGNGSGIFNYQTEAQNILDAMLHQKDDGSGVNMFDSSSNQVVFCPYGNSATFTDPSYHLPAFYECWAKWANKDNSKWTTIAATSRTFFQNTTNSSTGLGPDYANFDGTPHPDGNHGDFRFDAWRIASNIAVDYAWWAKDSWQKTFADRIQSFFKSKGIGAYGNQWSLSGNQLSSDHSPGLVAMNAVSGLASTTTSTWDFVGELWNTAIPSGQYRYYDGMLYFLGLLHCSGNFRIYTPGGTVSTPTPTQRGTPSPTAMVTATPTTTLRGTLAPSSTATPTPTPTVRTVPTPTSVSGQIEAENYSSQSGTSNIAADGGTAVQYSSSSSWTSYSVNFGPNSSIQVRASDPGYGANIQFRLGSASGQVFCTVYPSGGGSWNTSSNTCYPQPTGNQTVYVTVTSSNVKINWFKFQ